MLKTKKVSKIVALVLTMLTVLSVMFAFGGTSANAATTLSESGKLAMKDLLNEDISGNADINKYEVVGSTKGTDDTGSKTCTLASKYKVHLRSDNEELTKPVQLFKLDDKTFSFNGSSKQGFQDITDSSFQQAMINEFAKLMANKYRNRFTDSDRTLIYNEVKDNCGQANAAMVAALFQDTKADMFSALRIFQPFNGIVGTILGIFVIAIIVLLLGSTALDMAYINFPVARNFMYGKEKEGSDKGGAKKPWGVTADAWSVVNECEGTGGGSGGGDGKYKNANIAYFKRRINAVKKCALIH